MSSFSLIDLSWLLGLRAVPLVAALAVALLASLIQISKLRKSLCGVNEEVARCTQRLASAHAELSVSRARTLQWSNAMREYLARRRHDLLGDMNVASGFLLILKPQIANRLSVEQLDYFERALGGLNWAIAAADSLRDGAPEEIGPPQLPALAGPEASPENVDVPRRLEVAL